MPNLNVTKLLSRKISLTRFDNVRSQNAIGVFCDLSKAFDFMDYGILLSKLEYYGANGKANNLIASYHNNRI